MSEQIEFDIRQGNWRITGSYADQDNIVIYHHGEHYRTVTFPSYKIWNIAAHADEIVVDLEAEVREEDDDE